MKSLWSQFRYRMHTFPSHLEKQLAEHLIEHNLMESNYKLDENVVRVDIDLPGMILASRSWQQIKIDTLNIGIPSSDVEQFLYNLKLTKLKTFKDGTEYYVIHGFMMNIVLTPEQRLLMIDALEEILLEAMKITELEQEQFQAAIDEVNEDGVKVLSIKDKNYRKDVLKLIQKGKKTGEIN